MPRSSFALPVAFAVLTVLPAPPAALAQDPGATSAAPAPLAAAARRSTPIVLDGRLDEAAWQAARPAADFRQAQPREGEPATQRTEIRFLFDDEALYVAARMYDTERAAGIRTRLLRRDSDLSDCDYVQLIFDSFHDHLGRVSFGVNPSGVKFDAYGPGGANLDTSWDAVWDVSTRTDSLGWVAEFRIPLTQLRYSRDSAQTWGLQVWRNASRTNELSQWSFWRLNETGGPPRFGHLEGLSLTRAPGRAEVLPYVVARASSDPSVEVDNPFSDRREYAGRVGADLKYMLSSNLTLNATINPDFGQVEVDPAVVNLTAFETYFQERRPFFVEGSGLYEFGWMNCFTCSNIGTVDLFYPRRIGRRPQGEGNAYARRAGGFADVPENSRILGAAKITGQAGRGWTIGLLDAVTARENAQIETGASQRLTMEVEPFTNYFVGRLSRDLGGGGFVRGMATSVVRDIQDPTLRTQLTSHSEAGGLETMVWWGQHTYRFMGHVAYTQVAGDSFAILRVQQNPARYFQRPDRDSHRNGLFTNGYDPSLTAMRGYSAYGRLAKESGDWLWEVSGLAKSPGLEANDVAYNSQADRLWMSANVLRQFTRPNRFARQMTFILGGQQGYNYDGDLVDRQLQVYAGLTFLNYWNLTAFAMYTPERLDDQATRDGPVVGRAGGVNSFYQFSSDTRKRVSVNGQGVFGCRDGVCWHGFYGGLTVRPASNVSLSLGPNVVNDPTGSWYVTSVDDSLATSMYGRRYVFGQIRQRTLSMNTRLNVTFTPTLTLELYLQPLIVSAAYTRFHEYNRPRTLDRTYYGVNGGTIEDSAGVLYKIDPDGAGPAALFRVWNPNFNYRSLRGNAVVRWEFRPGSTLYLVWTQQREDAAPYGDVEVGRDLRGLFDHQSRNVFLVKMSYWMGF